ncbi:MAG: hypothetical protein ACLFNX_09355 [Spirochaetaceae bacterium]
MRILETAPPSVKHTLAAAAAGGPGAAVTRRALMRYNRGTNIMFQSNGFRKRLRKIDSSVDRDDGPRRIDEIRGAFSASLSFLPEPMRAELFDHFSAKYRAEASSYTVDDALFLGDVIDLFSGAYDDEQDPLDAEDWDFVKDIIDENALELDMDTINYVMKLVVDKGAL